MFLLCEVYKFIFNIFIFFRIIWTFLLCGFCFLWKYTYVCLINVKKVNVLLQWFNWLFFANIQLSFLSHSVQTSEVPNIDNIFRHDVDLHLTSCILVSKILFHISVSNLFSFILSLFCSVEKISLQIFKLLKTNNKPSMLFWLHVTGNNNLTSWFNIWNRKLLSELKHIACDTPTPFTKYF